MARAATPRPERAIPHPRLSHGHGGGSWGWLARGTWQPEARGTVLLACSAHSRGQPTALLGESVCSIRFPHHACIHTHTEKDSQIEKTHTTPAAARVTTAEPESQSEQRPSDRAA